MLSFPREYWKCEFVDSLIGQMSKATNRQQTPQELQGVQKWEGGISADSPTSYLKYIFRMSNTY